MPNRLKLDAGQNINVSGQKYTIIKELQSTGATVEQGGVYLLKSPANKQYVLKSGVVGTVGSPHERKMLKQAGIEISYEESNGLAKLVMPYYPGKALNFMMEEENLSHANDEIKLTLMYQLFVSLNQLHSTGIVHDDLHLANILFDKQDKKVHIVDLGKAHNLGNALLRKGKGREAYKNKTVTICQELDIGQVAKDIFEPLQLEQKELESASKNPIFDRPSVIMILIKIQMDALKKNYNVWNDTQSTPSMEMCRLIYAVADAVNQYKHLYMREKNKIFSFHTKYHSAKSAAEGNMLVQTLLKQPDIHACRDVLTEFLEHYPGSHRQHSLKVLIAEHILNTSFNSDPERKNGIQKLMKFYSKKTTNQNLS